jgi:hypothetical protein
VRGGHCAIAAVALALAGCAMPGGWFSPEDKVPAFRDAAVTTQAAAQRIVLGQSTKADVAAVLGPAQAIVFDSGYEVWVWRVLEPPAAQAKTEFVVLFAPSGLATRMRVRPPSPAP